MILQVEYQVPVMVEVDTRTGSIERVVVCDSDVKPTGRCFRDGDEIRSSRAKRRAAEVAESGMWPGWDFGY